MLIDKIDKKFNAFRDGKFRSLVKFSVEWRYATLAATIALLIAVIGLVASGRIGFNFFPPPESDKVIVNLKNGTSTTVAIFNNDQNIIRLAETSSTPLSVKDIRYEQSMSSVTASVTVGIIFFI